MAFGLVFALLLTEVGLHLAEAQRFFAMQDFVVGFRLRPNFSRVLPAIERKDTQAVLRTNNLGVRRDDDLTLKKQAGTMRVLVLGDSQTEGLLENSETYAIHLEKRLNADGAGHVQVLNAGTSGYSPLLEYLYLQRWGMRLDPDVIVLGIYVGNDMGEIVSDETNFGGFGPRFETATLERSGNGWRFVLPGGEHGWLGRLDWWLQTKLRSYALLRNHIHGAGITPPTGMHEVIRRCPGCIQTLWQGVFAHGEVDALDGSFDRLDYLLGCFATTAQNAHKQLLIAVVPTKVEVEWDRAAPDFEKAESILDFHYDARAFDDGVRRRIISLAEKHRVKTVDLLPALSQAHQQTGMKMYWDFDWHLDVEGHQVVAKALYPAVAEALRAAGGH